MSATPPMYSPAPFPPAPAAPRKKPVYKRVWFWLLALLVVVVAAAAANAGSTSSVTASSGGSGSAAAQPAAATIGTSVRDGDFEFTVTDVARGQTELGNQYLSTTAQGEFVLVNLTVRNIGNEPGTLFDQNTKLFDTQGREFRPSSGAAIYLPEQTTMIAQSINPGNQVSGTVVFDVPTGTHLASVELHDSAFSNGVLVALS